MKKKALFLVVACAMILSAQPVFAELATCADWAGKWTFKYDKDGVKTCDNVTLTVCEHPSGKDDGTTPACMPTKPGDTAPQYYWYCIAQGKRQSDNQTIQIRQISFDNSKTWSYYEKTNEEIFVEGGQTPANFIPPPSFTKGDDNKTTFIVDNNQGPPISAPPVADTGIACGVKPIDASCSACGAVGCTLKIIPKTVRKLLKLTEPISAIVFISDGNAEFTADDKPVYATTAIIPLLKVKIGTKIMISIVFVNPLSKDSGTYEVTVGECSGVINVK